MDEFVVTEKGYKELEEKLRYLKSEKRAEIAKNIGIARDFGDLSENAEYSAAKDEQAQVEMEIKELEYKIANAKVIDEKDIVTDIVSVGCYVKLYDEEFDEELMYHIVGSSESNPMAGLISNISPVGVAVIGKKKGEVAVAQTPNGEMRFKILDISREPIK